ncbi:MAG: hypothetical protein EOO01_00100, partial [Chitinophagaceae bacterium]
MKYLLHRGRYYYPSELPAEMVCEQPREGRIMRDLPMPLEDMSMGWTQAGEVGQEVYGGAMAYIMTTYAYKEFAGVPVVIFSDYPIYQAEYQLTDKNSGYVVVRLAGTPDCQCRVRLLPKNRKLPSVQLFDEDDPDGSGEGMLESVSNDMSFFMEKQGYNFRNSIKQWMAEVLEVLYAAAALCINVVRTFILIVLTILGPLVFGFAVFDGFQQSLTVWIARYVNIFMWLPIANILGSILGKIQENMLKLDISQIGQEGETFFSSSDVAYLIFMVIGIVAYFCVPTVANYIVHAGGGNTILQKTNMIVSSSSRTVASAGSAGMGMAADALGNGPRLMSQGYAGASQGDYFPDGNSGGSAHQRDRLSGK